MTRDEQAARYQMEWEFRKQDNQRLTILLFAAGGNLFVAATALVLLDLFGSSRASTVMGQIATMYGGAAAVIGVLLYGTDRQIKKTRHDIKDDLQGVQSAANYAAHVGMKVEEKVDVAATKAAEASEVVKTIEKRTNGELDSKLLHAIEVAVAKATQSAGFTLSEAAVRQVCEEEFRLHSDALEALVRKIKENGK